MLKVQSGPAETHLTNMMSFHAGERDGPLVLVDNFSPKELKHYAMIGLEKAVRDVLGKRCQARDLTTEEVTDAVESLLGKMNTIT